MRRVIVIGVLIFACLACVAIPAFVLPQAGLGPGARNGAQANLSKAIVDKGDLRLTVSATGSIVANRQSKIGFDQPGRVLEVLVKEGQRVEAGQLLARQDDSTQQAALAQAESSLKAAEANLQKILRPVDPGDIAKAEANVKSAQGQYSSLASSVSSQTVKTYELQYQKAVTAAENAEKVRRDAGGRYAQDDPNYQKAVAQVGSAQFDAEIAKLNLEKAKRGRSLAEATAQIAYQQALLAQVKAGPKQVDIDAAQAEFEIAKMQRDEAQHALEKTRLIAPFAGIATTVNLKAGEISGASTIVITDSSALYADVNVDETDIAKVLIGQPVEITLDALSGVTLRGKVQRIASTADTTTAVITYRVRITLDPSDAALKVGMTANAVFLVRDLKNVLRVPNQYLKLNRSTRQTTVNLVQANGSVMEVPVTLGIQAGEYSEVIEGLNEGEVVALVLDNAAANAQ
jgi:HlyD family secretion protein